MKRTAAPILVSTRYRAIMFFYFFLDLLWQLYMEVIAQGCSYGSNKKTSQDWKILAALTFLWQSLCIPTNTESLFFLLCLTLTQMGHMLFCIVSALEERLDLTLEKSNPVVCPPQEHSLLVNPYPRWDI